MKIEFDIETIKNYDTAGPRYTSYPTAVAFDANFNETSFREHAQLSNTKQDNAPLSLYFHIPFCDTICFYCACNKIATKDYSKADTYLEYLYREIDMQAKLYDSDRVVEQLHWGGGTPTFLNHQAN
ncbi:Oxygen-independent coproporphyrinogen III oxidase [Nymphon striatum]|nr:Oxygen-independent coproporphyrinogen III oxidase [Nymphon striatum]